MTTKITSLADHKASKQPHMSGEAVCLVCKHKWVAVAPTGTHQLECPSCGLHKGIFVALASSADDTLVWNCDCGNIYYEARTVGLLCIICGTNHPYANLKF